MCYPHSPQHELSQVFSSSYVAVSIPRKQKTTTRTPRSDALEVSAQTEEKGVSRAPQASCRDARKAELNGQHSDEGLRNLHIYVAI
jgi:hypothetical protein